jgi:hypothetical protein
MESSSRTSAEKSTPISSSTSRAAHVTSGSSLLILPFGKPLDVAVQLAHLKSKGLETGFSLYMFKGCFIPDAFKLCRKSL